MAETRLVETFIKIAGLCLTYVAFQSATDVCREPVARVVEKLERKGLLECFVEIIQILEDLRCRALSGKPSSSNTKSQMQTRTNAPLSASAPQSVSNPTKSPKKLKKADIKVTDLCNQCRENYRTVEALRKVSVEMGVAYPGDEIEPCSLCKDRHSALHELETMNTRLSRPALGRG